MFKRFKKAATSPQNSNDPLNPVREALASLLEIKKTEPTYRAKLAEIEQQRKDFAEQASVDSEADVNILSVLDCKINWHKEKLASLPKAVEEAETALSNVLKDCGLAVSKIAGEALNAKRSEISKALEPHFPESVNRARIVDESNLLAPYLRMYLPASFSMLSGGIAARIVAPRFIAEWEAFLAATQLKLGTGGEQTAPAPAVVNEPQAA